MLIKINKLKSIGSFINFSSSNDSSLDFGKMNLILGNNGNGKTTFSTILDSLNKNEPKLIFQKKCLKSVETQESILSFQNNNFKFYDGLWKMNGDNLNNELNKFIIFDDEFIKNNFFDEKFERKHKVNLHRIIFGEKGIKINDEIEKNKFRLEEVKKEINLGLSDEILKICNFDENKIEEIKEEFKKNSIKIKQIQSIDEIRKHSELIDLSFIEFEFEDLIINLSKEINSESHNSAKKMVNEFKEKYFKNQENYENFIELGFQNYKDNVCPFCHKEFDSDEIIELYKKFFDKEFEIYKKAILDSILKFNSINLDIIFERFTTVVKNNQKYFEYWVEKKLKLINFEDIDFDNIINLKNLIKNELVLKKNNINFEVDLTNLNSLKNKILELNEKTNIIKETIKQNNLLILQYKKELGDLSLNELNEKQLTLTNIIDRFDSKKSNFDEFKKIHESIIKLKKDMTDYTDETRDDYLVLINDKLEKLGLRNLKLNNINSTHIGNANNMNVEITLELENNNIDMKSNSDEKPAFNNTLSSGERNALAFAFFLVQLEKVENLENKILVLDDPLTSLDDDRKRQVSLQIKYFKDKVLQTIVLTHKNSFFKILYNLNRCNVKTFELKKDDANGSRLVNLNIKEYLKEKFQRRLEKLQKFIENDFDYPELETDIRKVLERIISSKHYLDRKSLGKTIVTYDGFKKLFWSKGKLLDEKERILSICKITNDESHDDILKPVIYENLSYVEKKDIVLEVFKLIEKI